jgi:TRAP-type mannitol/chloroaromatic compound transport system permease large subunit
VLIVLVLGSILTGVATPTESSSVGGVGAILLAAFYGRFSVRMVWESSLETVKITAMVFAILIGATAFSMVFTYTGGDYIVVPILVPIAAALGINPVWYAILIAMNLQTSFLTPPFGFSLFYLKGVAPPEVRTTDIYYGVMPFIILQMIVLAILVVFPQWFGFPPHQ